MINTNKKGFLARDWVVAAILFSGIIALLVLGVGSVADNYDKENITSDSFQDKFDKFENNTKLAQSMWNQSSGEGGLSTVGTFDVLFKATFGVISLVFDSVKIAGQQMFSFIGYFGVPSEVGLLFFTILSSILAVLIVFIVISSVSRRDI